MPNQDTFETSKRSFISAFWTCLTILSSKYKLISKHYLKNHMLLDLRSWFTVTKAFNTFMKRRQIFLLLSRAFSHFSNIIKREYCIPWNFPNPHMIYIYYLPRNCLLVCTLMASKPLDTCRNKWRPTNCFFFTKNIKRTSWGLVGCWYDVSQTIWCLIHFTKVLSKTGMLEKISNCLTFLLKLNANDTHQPIDKTGKVTVPSPILCSHCFYDMRCSCLL